MVDTATFPEGWEPYTIGSLCDLINGRGFKKIERSESGLPIIRIQNLNNPNAPFNYFDGEYKEQIYVHKGDLLFAWSGTPGTSFGAHMWNGPEGVLNQHIYRVLPNEEVILKGYFARALNSKLTELIAGAHGGVGLRHITKKKLEATEIGLPPLNEQRRIADKIDALQAKSRRVREALETVGPLLEKFRQSVLAAAFRGDLTAEWRKQNPDVEPAEKLLERIRTERRARWEEAELAKMRAKGKEPKNDKWKAKYKEPEPVDTSELPELPEGWCWTTLENLIYSIVSGKSPRASSTPATDNEKGVLKVSAVSWGQFNAAENKRLPDDFQIDSIPTVQTGDLLISRANTVELVGAVVVAKEDHPNLILSDKILKLNVASDLCPAPFLKFALRTQWVRDVFEDQATGTSNSMRNLSQGKIMSAPIPLPTREEIGMIEKLLTASEKKLQSQVHIVENGKVQIAKLDQSILAKAFRGELVSQDPNDEPASVLLERIKAERGAAKDKKKTRRKK